MNINLPLFSVYLHTLTQNKSDHFKDAHAQGKIGRIINFLIFSYNNKQKPPRSNDIFMFLFVCSKTLV